MADTESALLEIAAHLNDIKDGIWHNKESNFTIRVAHVLTCTNLCDMDKLQCIKILYFQLAWPERKLNDYQTQLLESVK